MPADTPLIARLVNEVSYLAVVGVAITGLSQLRRTQAQLQQLATHDPLTNVLNARAFSAELAQELGRNRRYGRPLAVIYLDLDDFKKVNDVHGHATGDAVLRLVADATRSAVRQADVVGRLGGDEFGVLMPETEGIVAHAAATRLAAGIRTVFRGTPSVTASIGVVSVTGMPVTCDACRSACCSLRITALAASAPASGSSKANWSAPKRATRSLARIASRAVSATRRSTPSASWCPNRSCNSLKSSASKYARVNGWLYRRARSNSRLALW